MGSKNTRSVSLIDHNEADELRVAVRELNQSIAYLSKMVLQLQRSMTSRDGGEPPRQEKPETLH
jgi:hypothetical protein